MKRRRDRAWAAATALLGAALVCVVARGRLVGLGAQETACNHTLCVLVPFRHLVAELQAHVCHMGAFLERQGVCAHTVVVNQVDAYRFNRGMLLNAAAHLAAKHHADCDYYALHDVDLLPLNPALSYAFPGDGQVVHLSPPALHPRYKYPDFLGGILLVSRAAYAQIDGMSNSFWGWGKEDDELRKRLLDGGLAISQPRDLVTGGANNQTFLHLHDESRRVRDKAIKPGQAGMLRKRDRATGLHDARFTVVQEDALAACGYRYLLASVQLDCDARRTPWCTP